MDGWLGSTLEGHRRSVGWCSIQTHSNASRTGVAHNIPFPMEGRSAQLTDGRQLTKERPFLLSSHLRRIPQGPAAACLGRGKAPESFEDPPGIVIDASGEGHGAARSVGEGEVDVGSADGDGEGDGDGLGEDCTGCRLGCVNGSAGALGGGVWLSSGTTPGAAGDGLSMLVA
jgi:hypothetical protein